MKRIILGAVLAATMGAASASVNLSCDKESGRSNISNFTVDFETWQKAAYLENSRGKSSSFDVETKSRHYLFTKASSSGNWFYFYEVDRKNLTYVFSGKTGKGKAVYSKGSCEMVESNGNKI